MVAQKNKTGHFNGILSFSFLVSQFPMGPGPDGPMGGMGGMEQHHMNGSLGECSAMHGGAFVARFSPVEPSLRCRSDRDLFFLINK